MSRFVRQPPNAPADVVWVAGGEVDEYRIAVGFYGEDLDPAEITKLLGREPTSQCRRGDIVNGKVSSRVEKVGRWVVAPPVTPGESLDPQLRRLLGSMTDDLTIWHSLVERYKSRFMISTWIRSWNRGLEIEPELVRAFADRRLGIGVDIYVDDDDEHDV